MEIQRAGNVGGGRWGTCPLVLLDTGERGATRWGSALKAAEHTCCQPVGDAAMGPGHAQPAVGCQLAGGCIAAGCGGAGAGGAAGAAAGAGLGGRAASPRAARRVREREDSEDDEARLSGLAAGAAGASALLPLDSAQVSADRRMQRPPCFVFYMSRKR